MAPEPEQPETIQESKQGSSASEIADLSEGGSIADDDSFQYDGDGDGDGENGQEQEVAGDAPQETDDYAMTFDSPAEKEQMDGEEEDQQQRQEVVSNAPESKNIIEPPVQPDAVPTQTTQPAPADPPAPSLAEQPPQPVQASTAQDVAVSQPSENGSGAAPAQEDVPNAASAISTVQLEVATSEGASDVQPKPEDVEMTTESAPDATPLDIQKLVDEITAKSEATEPDNKPAVAVQPSPSSTDVDMSSLPPKPALTHEQSKQTYTPTTYHHASLPSAPSFPPGSASLPAQPLQSSQPPQPAYASNGAGTPGIPQQPPYNAAPAAFASYPSAYPPANAPQQAPGFSSNGIQQTYDEFLADERKAMAEAKWERFPEGSRIFIGNLSQERVSKRDVFELFHQHGRLAQISLKSAYGFVQYYTTAEAQSAMNGLQGAEVKGRKINLEISRTQKSKKDREHSPERRNRNDRSARNGDRYDGGRRRDDFRGGRSPSPRRDDHRGRQDPYSRDRGHHDSFSRKRSRSPDSYRRQDTYRQRSPSPYGRGRQESASDQLDIPRRYGNDVPDVQILMMQDVHKDFVDWVQRAFYEQGLRPNAMFLNPRFPREAVIQRQVLEGVHGVVELDMRAQHTAKISLQVFDRSAGSNVRFDQYQELDPPVAAQLVLRTKGSVAQPPAYPPQPSYPPQPYGAPAPYGGYPQPPVQQPPAATPDLTSLVGQLSQMPNVDNNTLQTILASLQQQQPTPTQPPPVNYAAYQGQPQGAPPPQVDYNALINNISAASVKGGQPPMGAGVPGYPQPGYPQGNRGPPQPVAGSTDPARDVENIMATLARYR
ncbi:nuclear polyadenylated RNA-binding protein 3 [Gnomoniopsis smithogilvyi]|uniref:Nuclear polyadenylated RNA-binding protein 3 n=1 Tax=Gnomoniopsis smithogilvyi TaxID=1191159 RepID=A0A9W8YQK5_9PEZI|nr:nuclear polyadenylated RNA-binding protein 3 [Gnomoniopsis smithogilvyi]